LVTNIRKGRNRIGLRPFFVSEWLSQNLLNLATLYHMTRRQLPFTIFAITCFALLWPAVWSGQIPAFRDTLHFYYPLWSFLEQSDPWSQILPSWNRYDVFGSSMIGEASTMAFYPFRFVLLVDLLSLGQRIGIFLFLHLMLANVTTYRFARYLRLPRVSAHVAAVSYALSGPVVFQVYNPIFLIGAAWLPFALHMGWKIFRDGSPRAMLGLSAALAMMVFGGDAQTAYHVILIGIILVAFQIIQNGMALLRSRIGRQQPITKAWYQSIFRGNAVLAVILSVGAVTLAVGLSAVQILPTLDWVSSSNRAVAGSRFDSQRFQFSVSMSDWLTTIVPFFKGGLVPYHTRWFAALSPGDRVWAPSLHFGIIGVALFVISLFSGVDRSTRRLRIIFITAFLSSLGMYGLGYVLNTVGNWLGNAHPSGQIAHEIGGLQWLWSKVLPFYSEFRYPAKWLPFALLPACLIGAKSLLSIDVRLPSLRVVFGLIAAAGAGTAIFAGLLPGWELTTAVPIEPLCGSFTVAHTQSHLLVSGLQTMVLGLLAPSLIAKVRKTADSVHVPWSAIVLICAVTADVSISAYSTLAFVSPTCLQSSNNLAPKERDLQLELTSPDGIPVSNWLCKIAEAQTANDIGKLHLLGPHQSRFAQFSFEPAAIERFKQLDDQQSWLDTHLTPGVSLEWESPSVCRLVQQTANHGPIVVPVFAAKGWKAYSVDAAGKKSNAPIATVEGAFISVNAPAADSVIQLEYHTPGIYVGSIISIIAWVGWSVSFLFTARRPQ
jgi:hypothetical protein